MISSRWMFVTGTSAVGTRYSSSRVTTYMWSSLSGICPVPRAEAAFTRVGGQISVMPCSRVWMPIMKSMSARWSAAPAPR